jgi:hypothetical protein
MEQDSASTGETQQKIRARMHRGYDACATDARSSVLKLPGGDEVDSGKHIGDV